MKPLQGIVVVDFSRVLAAPLATMILAELGATVIKIERPGSGDETRTWEPIFGKPGGGKESGYFFAFNRAKQSLTLNLKSAKAQAIARKLAAKADLLVENFPPGNEPPGRVPSAAFKCRDGKWLHITGSDQHWEPLCQALGLERLLADEDLKKNAARVERRGEVMAALREAISKQDRPQVLAALDAADVPGGPIHALDEVPADSHTKARRL